MNIEIPKSLRIAGSGGGKGGGSSEPSDENTIRSRAYIRLIDVISEGRIKGLVDGSKSIYLNETPIRNKNDSYNFRGIKIDQHKGLADEGHFRGHSEVESTVSVEQTVVHALPVQRTIVAEEADAVRVIMTLPALYRIDPEGGRLTVNNVRYEIHMRSAGGAWVRVVNNDMINEKCVSPTQIDHRIELPAGGSPWDIRVTRIKPDETIEGYMSDVVWSSYVILTEGKFIYPQTAAIAVQFNAQDIGNGQLERAYHVEGRFIKVPSNYDPETAIYTGIWDGTFISRYSNNPAWIFYDMIDDDIFGLGDLIDISKVDKWALYTIAQYCDQKVDTGYKNDLGVRIRERRYTFNGVINSQREAFFVLQAMTTVWRGMSYWSLGQVFATIDAPADSVRLLGPANVLGGEFNYASTSIKARHSVVLVEWNDPDDFYRKATEAVVDEQMIEQIGWREKTLSLEGCTSRSMAHRYGRWVIDTEKTSTETVTFTAGWDQIMARPGEIISISDPRKAQVRLAGRVVSHTSTEIIMDADFEPEVGETYTIKVVLQDGSILVRPVLETYPGDKKRLRVASSASLAQPNAMFMIIGSNVFPREYRIISVDEGDNSMMNVTATFHDPDKYARVERGMEFAAKPYKQKILGSTPPSNVTIAESTITQDGRTRTQLLLSWTAPADTVIRNFVVTADTPLEKDFLIGTTTSNTITFEAPEPGEYKVFIQTMDHSGVMSDKASITYTVIGGIALSEGTISDLQNRITGNMDASVPFSGPDAVILWKNNFPTTTLAAGSGSVNSEVQSPLYKHNVVRVYDNGTGTLLRFEKVKTPTYRYTREMNLKDALAIGQTSARRAIRLDVTLVDVFERESAIESIIMTNPVPVLVTPTVGVRANIISVEWPFVDDEDYAGTKVWISTVSGFNPLVTTPKFNGAGNAYTFAGAADTTYYVRVGSYDQFGDTGMIISSEVSTTTSAFIDAIAPATPVGLSLSTSLVTGAAKVTANWTASVAPDLAFYEVRIAISGGATISYVTTAITHEWIVPNGASCSVDLKAVDTSRNASAFCTAAVISAAVDTVAPAVPTGFAATAGFDAIWLKWTANAEVDFDRYEFYEAAITTAPVLGTTASFSANGTQAARTGYDGVVVRYFWIRAVDTSGNKSAWSSMLTTGTIDLPDTSVNTVHIAGGAITAAKLTTGELITLTAQIKDAIISNAKIIDLSAVKITAGTVLAGSILVGATALSQISSDALLGATDPGTRVNAGSTKINPGQILISGATTLSDWRRGGDVTKIDGGAISANTITANKIEVGSRNIAVRGLVFEHNAPALNSVSWSAGTLVLMNDAGVSTSYAISANNVAWTAGIVYIYWVKDALVLSTTTTAATAFGADRVMIATYEGGTKLTATLARTVIDGDTIKTGAIASNHLVTGSAVITGTAQIADAVITNAKITGAIQSVDFDASNGWKIDKAGTAKFSNVVVRGMLSVGAISDENVLTEPAVIAGSVTQQNSGICVRGFVDRGSILLRGVVFDAQAPNHNVGVGDHDVIATLQAAFKDVGAGAYGAWIDLNTWTVHNTSWNTFSDTGTLAGTYDNVKYRLVWISTSSQNNAAVNVMKNIVITIKEITR